MKTKTISIFLGTLAAIVFSIYLCIGISATPKYISKSETALVGSYSSGNHLEVLAIKNNTAQIRIFDQTFLVAAGDTVKPIKSSPFYMISSGTVLITSVSADSVNADLVIHNAKGYYTSQYGSAVLASVLIGFSFYLLVYPLIWVFKISIRRFKRTRKDLDLP